MVEKPSRKERDGQLDATTVPAVDRREDDRADRPGDKGQREHGEGVKRRRHGFRKGEEHLGEDHHGGDGENEEVEILCRPADDDADGDLTRRDLVVGGHQAGVALERRGGGLRSFNLIHRHLGDRLQ